MHIVTPPAYRSGTSPRGNGGFTMAEMLISMGIMVIVIGMMMTAFLFGLKQDQLVQSKLGASDESRRGFERVSRDIRSANSHDVGNYTVTTNGGVFTDIGNGTPQVGNALRIFMYSNTSTNVVYYFDTNGAQGTWTLNRIHTGEASTVIASHLQSNGTFSAEDYTGTVQSSALDKDVIHFSLDFCEYQYPLTKVGTNFHYDRYVMDFRATPHVPGGK